MKYGYLSENKVFSIVEVCSRGSLPRTPSASICGSSRWKVQRDCIFILSCYNNFVIFYCVKFNYHLKFVIILIPYLYCNDIITLFLLLSLNLIKRLKFNDNDIQRQFLISEDLKNRKGSNERKRTGGMNWRGCWSTRSSRSAFYRHHSHLVNIHEILIKNASDHWYDNLPH